MLIHRTYQQRGYCRRGGYERLRDVLAICGELYNAALQERRDAWRLHGVSVSLFDQTVEFTELRQKCGEWAALDVGQRHATPQPSHPIRSARRRPCASAFRRNMRFLRPGSVGNRDLMLRDRIWVTPTYDALRAHYS